MPYSVFLVHKGWTAPSGLTEGKGTSQVTVQTLSPSCSLYPGHRPGSWPPGNGESQQWEPFGDRMVWASWKGEAGAPGDAEARWPAPGALLLRGRQYEIFGLGAS